MQHVIYHARCNDGFASAYIAWRKFGKTAKYTAASYGQTPDRLDGEDVTLVDFCYPRPVMDAINAQVASLTILDHHATAHAAMQGFCPKCGVMHFDMKKSGARLTFEHYFPQEQVPAFVEMVEDFDLWKHEIPGAAEFTVMLDTLPMTFEAWDSVYALQGADLKGFIAAGKAIKDRIDAYAANVAEDAVEFTIGAEKGLLVNSPRDMRSEVGNLLARRSGTFGGNWYLAADGTIKVSLRSVAPYDVRKLAERFPGGGGHAQAAGFSLDASRIGEIISRCLIPSPST
jgi:oligoribonuclease NrnB/cAMP/cGMP phosphodiesterase (DHH superfamily)